MAVLFSGEPGGSSMASLPPAEPSTIAAIPVSPPFDHYSEGVVYCLEELEDIVVRVDGSFVVVKPVIGASCRFDVSRDAQSHACLASMRRFRSPDLNASVQVDSGTSYEELIHVLDVLRGHGIRIEIGDRASWEYLSEFLARQVERWERARKLEVALRGSYDAP
jgi:hypothetical protein